MQWSLFHCDSFYSFYVTWNHTVSSFLGDTRYFFRLLLYTVYLLKMSHGYQLFVVFHIYLIDRNFLQNNEFMFNWYFRLGKKILWPFNGWISKIFTTKTFLFGVAINNDRSLYFSWTCVQCSNSYNLFVTSYSYSYITKNITSYRYKLQTPKCN
jgi:hypothetical protein